MRWLSRQRCLPAYVLTPVQFLEPTHGRRADSSNLASDLHMYLDMPEHTYHTNTHKIKWCHTIAHKTKIMMRFLTRAIPGSFTHSILTTTMCTVPRVGIKDLQVHQRPVQEWSELHTPHWPQFRNHFPQRVKFLNLGLWLHFHTTSWPQAPSKPVYLDALHLPKM